MSQTPAMRGCVRANSVACPCKFHLKSVVHPFKFHCESMQIPPGVHANEWQYIKKLLFPHNTFFSSIFEQKLLNLRPMSQGILFNWSVEPVTFLTGTHTNRRTSRLRDCIGPVHAVHAVQCSAVGRFSENIWNYFVLHVTCPLSCVTCHVSPTAFHLSHVTTTNSQSHRPSLCLLPHYAQKASL